MISIEAVILSSLAFAFMAFVLASNIFEKVSSWLIAALTVFAILIILAVSELVILYIIVVLILVLTEIVILIFKRK